MKRTAPGSIDELEFCAICGCQVHRGKNVYGKPTPEGRAHASRHHYIAERFFGRSKNRTGTQRQKIFAECPWAPEDEGATALFCYDCHEELIHNPVLLPDDIVAFGEIVKRRHLDETKKDESRTQIAGRIKLFHEVIKRGLEQLSKD